MLGVPYPRDQETSKKLPVFARPARACVPFDRAGLGGSWARSLAVWSIPAVLAALLWLPAAWRRRTVIAGHAGRSASRRRGLSTTKP